MQCNNLILITLKLDVYRYLSFLVKRNLSSIQHITAIHACFVFNIEAFHATLECNFCIICSHNHQVNTTLQNDCLIHFPNLCNHLDTTDIVFVVKDTVMLLIRLHQEEEIKLVQGVSTLQFSK